MGYSIGLYQDGKAVTVSSHQEGSNVVVGGVIAAKMTVTYNYSPFYYESLDADSGLRWLYNKSFWSVKERLEEAIAVLGTERSENYWDQHPGNAGHVLRVLYLWARQHPNAVFLGD
jgi:hypothetical protein